MKLTDAQVRALRVLANARSLEPFAVYRSNKTVAPTRVHGNTASALAEMGLVRGHFFPQISQRGLVELAAAERASDNRPTRQEQERSDGR